MKFYKRALLTFTALVSVTPIAHADPVSIGSAIISGLLSVGAGAILPTISAATLGSIALGAGLIGLKFLEMALMPGQQRVDPGEFRSTFESGDSPEIRAIGRVRIGGLKVFGNTKSGRDRYRLIAHCRGPVTAIERHFLGGREVTVEPNGDVSSPPFARRDGSYVRIVSKAGDGNEAAWSELMTQFPSLWTEAHRVRGIAQSLIHYNSPGFGGEKEQEKFQKLYQSGVPEYEREQRSEPVFDPRDPSQNVANEATWKYADNGVLGGAHMLRSFPCFKDDDFDWPYLAAEATKADVPVATLTGTEPRARAWGAWTSEMKRVDTMQQLCDSVGLDVIYSEDNKLRLCLIDDDPEPEITLPARHILYYQWQSGPESVQRPNTVRLKYYSPERNFEMAEIGLHVFDESGVYRGPDWARVSHEVDRVGEQLTDLEFPFCPSASQAQRNARREALLARTDVGIVTMNFAGLAAWGKRTALIELTDLGTLKCKIGVPRFNDGDGIVEIPFAVIPQMEPWNPATMEMPPPEPLPEQSYESELPTPAAPANAAVIMYPNGTYETRVQFAGIAGGTVAEATFRLYAGADPGQSTSMVEYQGNGVWYGHAPFDSRGPRADFRVRFYDDDDNGSYSSPDLVKAPMAIDNSPPTAPAFTRSGDDFTLSTAAMNGVRALVTSIQTGIGGSSTTHLDQNIRPGQPVTFTHGVQAGRADQTFAYTARVYASDGTAGATATIVRVIPGDSGA